MHNTQKSHNWCHSVQQRAVEERCKNAWFARSEYEKANLSGISFLYDDIIVVRNPAPLKIVWICHLNWDRCFTGCPLEWLNYRDKCYFFSKDLHNFDSAKAACESLSASLLIISDKEEQVNLVRLATDVCRDKHECVDACLYSGAEMAEETSPRQRLLLDGSDWRGGGKRVALDRWDWACVYVCLKLYRCLLVPSHRNKHKQHHFIPLPFTCSMWKPGQPDNWGHGHDVSGEDCAGLVHEALWNDFFCQDLISYICEKELQQREEFIFIVLRASWKPGPHFVPLVSRSKTAGFIAKSGGRSNGEQLDVLSVALVHWHGAGRVSSGSVTGQFLTWALGVLQPTCLQVWREAFLLQL